MLFITMDIGISAKCKNCGNSAKLEDLKLDPTFGKVVCVRCINERMKKEGVKKLAPEEKKEEEKPKMPAGWDLEDEELERSYKEKIKSRVKVTRLEGDRVRYPCPKCSHLFTFNLKTRMPSSCPLCNEKIRSMRT